MATPACSNGLALAGLRLPLVGSEHIVPEHYRSRPLQYLLLVAGVELLHADAVPEQRPARERRGRVDGDEHGGGVALVGVGGVTPDWRGFVDDGRAEEVGDVFDVVFCQVDQK